MEPNNRNVLTDLEHAMFYVVTKKETISLPKEAKVILMAK
jgi:hypothetical protein